MARKSKTPAPLSYTVGKGKPPKETQFKKGQSGNPGGRPKKTAADPFTTIVRDELDRLVPITENGKRRWLPVFQVNLRMLTIRALSGDLKSQRELMRLQEKHQAPYDVDVTGTPVDHGAIVRQKLDAMAARMKEAKLIEDEERQAAQRKTDSSEPNS